ncbi:MAG: Filamentous hemagglutinin family outer membrane protein [Stygiobacter sp.]|nr:MAG: Filamentous hemagglutinin family outer membrane protein [Stygiobacter sp.]KAF0215297.1 MAG: Filamentous hemagglutinin family outer membrane [Ignavibacteria bacterium]
MKKLSYFFMLFSLLYVCNIQAQLLTRTAEIKEPSGKEVGGFGGVIAGVDFDKDGKPEIYACNTNMVDRAYELVPRIYKFELNPVTAKWDSVWSATSPLEKQNTWPAFTWGDLDKDGRPEIYWAPVNFSPYPDVARILVYEYPGDGSDNMGVADGLGGFLPNAMTNILTGAGLNIRPIKFAIADPDNDGKDELIFVDRQPTMHIGVLSVSDIPNLGGGTEKWTVEFDASTIAEIKATSAKYDVAVLNGVIYAWDGSGRVVSVKYTGGAWKLVKVQTSLNVIGSFKGSQVVDINNDGKKEILLADWFTNTKGAGAKVWLLQQNADTLQGTALVDLEPLGAVRLNGAGSGDLDNDGKLDFVCAARYDANNSRKVPVFRVEYQSGDITAAASFTASVIDSAYWTKNGDMDVVVVANVDGDKDSEVLYTQGYSRGNANDDRMPLIVLDSKYTKVSVEKITSNIPTEFYLEQNYPNPFNPSTQIRFGITEASNVELKVYDILGREVVTLIDREFMNAGVYNVKFNAVDLASGIYIYKLTTGNHSISKKMQLMK